MSLQGWDLSISMSEGRFLYVFNPPQDLSLEWAQFNDFGFSLREEKEDRDVYVEYTIKNVPEIFGNE